MTKEGTKPAIPESVEGAAQAWRVTAVLQLVLSALVLATYWRYPELLVSSEAAKANFPNFSADQLDTAVKSSVVVAFIFSIALCALFFFIISRMRKGGDFARSLLVVGTVYLAVSAAMSFFSAGATAAVTSDAMVLVSGVVRIISATAAVAGLVLVASGDAKKYFEAHRPAWQTPKSDAHLPTTPKRQDQQVQQAQQQLQTPQNQPKPHDQQQVQPQAQNQPPQQSQQVQPERQSGLEKLGLLNRSVQTQQGQQTPPRQQRSRAKHRRQEQAQPAQPEQPAQPTQQAQPTRQQGANPEEPQQ